MPPRTLNFFSLIVTTRTVRNLGFSFDEHLTFSDQIPAPSFMYIAILIFVNFAIGSGVTMNSRPSGTPGQISKSSLSSPFPTLSPPSAPSLPLTLPAFPSLLPLPFPPYTFTSSPSLPFIPSFHTILNLLFLLLPLPSPYNGWENGGLGRARPPKAFLCNLQPKISANLLKF